MVKRKRTGVFSMMDTMSMPRFTRPNTVCLPSSQGVSTVVMKNCEPLVPGLKISKPIGEDTTHTQNVEAVYSVARTQRSPSKR